MVNTSITLTKRKREFETVNEVSGINIKKEYIEYQR